MSDQNTFDPMASVDTPKKSTSSRAKTAFNIAAGVLAGFITKWVVDNDYLAIAVAPVASHLVSKTSLFEGVTKMVRHFGSDPTKQTDKPDINSTADADKNGPEPGA